MKKKSVGIQKKVFLVLVIIVLFLSVLNIVKAKGLLIPKQQPVDVKNKMVDLQKLTLE